MVRILGMYFIVFLNKLDVIELVFVCLDWVVVESDMVMMRFKVNLLYGVVGFCGYLY